MEALVLFAPQIFFSPQRKKEAQRKMQRNESKLMVESSRLMVESSIVNCQLSIIKCLNLFGKISPSMHL